MGQEIDLNKTFVVVDEGFPVGKTLNYLGAFNGAQIADATDVLAQAMASRNEDGTRKLATVRYIKALLPIEGADAIELAVVDGWKVVAQKGLHQVGDKVIYLEIDSFLQETEPRYSFLMKSGVREFEGVRGHKLRTIKLRGQISQGLILPLREFPEIDQDIKVGTDVTKLLGIKKWEPQIAANMAGLVKGDFPSFIRKTDQERCQNLENQIFVDNDGAEYEISVKLDGSSVTYYQYNGTIGACSRNLELKVNEDNKGNTLVKILQESGLDRALKLLNRNIAIQGEMMGPGIQGNRENLKTAFFYIFEMQDLDAGKNLSFEERRDVFNFLRTCNEAGVNDLIRHVPVLITSTLSELNIKTVDDLLAYAEGPSIIHPVREGLVFKRKNGSFSFKAISNKFLAKEKD
jgi:RNA ligase (TIGR02306 family)